MKRASEIQVIDLTATTEDSFPAKRRKSVQAIRSGSDDVEALREEWRTLYAETLPQAARGKDPAQKKWPVTLDHCFARIILDNAVGKEKPWTEAIKSPAIKNMTRDQIKAALDLGNRILSGSADLVELDEESLRMRGKNSKQKSPATVARAQQSVSVLTPKSNTRGNHNIDTSLLKLIDGSDKTDFQKTCLKLLCQIPSGTYSTYGAMARHLSSSARAVGNAMRGNPFAPRVPCHRILASDGTLGGFGGSWGVDGKHANEKMDLLTVEGVRFDSKGKVVGPVFTAFT